MNIREFLEERVAKNPEKVYLYFQDQQVTYEEFNKKINKTANSLWDLGIRKGDFFAIMLPNCPEFLYTLFGLNKIGAVQVPINLRLKGEEVLYILNHSEAKGIIIHSDYLPLLESIRENLPSLKHTVLLGGGMSAKTIPFQDWVGNAPAEFRPVVSLSAEDPDKLAYTSGTTGQPKGVLRSHQSEVLVGESWAYMMGASPDDRVMTPNPLFHGNALSYAVMGSLAANASLILIERFSRSHILEQTRHCGATILNLVAAMMPMVWSHPREENDGDNPVRMVFTGGFPEYYHDFEKRFQVEIHTLFSQTEIPIGLMAPREGTLPRKPTPGVGVPMEHPNPSFHNEAKIVNEAGEEVPRGEIGEIIIRNPGVMIGYFKEPEKTAETKRDGWIFSGDLGYQDEDRYFFYVGRKKEVLRHKGELIMPVEIETVINRHPKVMESAVIGVPSGLGIGEEEVKAYVVLKEGESATPQEIISWCNDKLADFKVPRYLEFRRYFPKTAQGKIQKNALKKEKQALAKSYDRLKEQK